MSTSCHWLANFHISTHFCMMQMQMINVYTLYLVKCTYWMLGKLPLFVFIWLNFLAFFAADIRQCGALSLFLMQMVIFWMNGDNTMRRTCSCSPTIGRGVARAPRYGALGTGKRLQGGASVSAHLPSLGPILLWNGAWHSGRVWRSGELTLEVQSIGPASGRSMGWAYHWEPAILHTTSTRVLLYPRTECL